jgi:hypothetical protein
MGGVALLSAWSWLRHLRRSAGRARHRRGTTPPVGARRRYPITGLGIATPYVVAMTDPGAVVAHLVTEEAVAAGRRAGRYAGVCDAVVLPGSLLECTGRCCRACRDWVAAK